MSFNSYTNSLTRDGYAVHNKDNTSCPQNSGCEQLAKPLLSRPLSSGYNPRGIELLGNSSSWINEWWSELCVTNLYGMAAHYATVLGGYSLGFRLDCPITPGRSQGFEAKKWAVLGNATYYPSLQYRCSQLSNGVLCDYSVDPPLSVDSEGRYLDRKSLSTQGNAKVYGKPLGNTSLEFAVYYMPGLGPFIAIICTWAFWGCCAFDAVLLHGFV